jgi:hypothetical protein
VAVVEPTGPAGARRIAGLTFGDERMRVLEHVAGRRLPAAFVLEGIADPRISGSTDCSPLITKGNAYLLYLTRDRRRPGGPPIPGRFGVVGGPMGAFAHHGTTLPAPGARVFVHQHSDVGRALPARISVAQARES